MNIGIVIPIYVSNQDHMNLLIDSITSIRIAQEEDTPDNKYFYIYSINKLRNYKDKQTLKDLSKELKINYIIIENKANCLSNAWNRGIEMCYENDCDLIHVANQDIWIHKYMLTLLNSYYDYGEIKKNECILYTANQGLTKKQAQSSKPPAKEQSKLGLDPDFSFFTIKGNFKEILYPKDPDRKNAGKFDTNFQKAYWEDCDMHFRILKAGFKAYRVRDAKYWHYGSGTYKLDRSDTNQHWKHFNANKKYFLEKWGTTTYTQSFDKPFNK